MSNSKPPRVGDFVRHSHFDGTGRIVSLNNGVAEVRVDLPRQETLQVNGVVTEVKILSNDDKATLLLITKSLPDVHYVSVDELEAANGRPE